MAHRPRFSTTSPEARVSNRTEERTSRYQCCIKIYEYIPSASWSKSLIFLVGAGTTWNSHAAPKRGRPFFASFFLFVNEFLGVMRVQPVQRLIVLGNRRYHLSTACLAASRDALLQRASSSTHERHRLRVHDHLNVPSQEELELFCELAGLARVQARLSLHKSREFFSGLEVGGLPS